MAVRAFITSLLVISLAQGAIASEPFTGTWVRCVKGSGTSCRDGPSEEGYIFRQYGKNICGVHFEKGPHAYRGRVLGLATGNAMTFRTCEDLQGPCTAKRWSNSIEASIKNRTLYTTVAIDKNKSTRTNTYKRVPWSDESLEPLSSWTIPEFAAACEQSSNSWLQYGPVQAPAAEPKR